MLKRVFIIAFLIVLLFQGSALAQMQGNVIFRDALYGAAIGGLLGGAIYLADQDDLLAKLGVGVAVGTLAGLFYGAREAQALVELKDNDIRLALPSMKMEKRDGQTLYAADLLKVRF
jgi:hypothetical protein